MSTTATATACIDVQPDAAWRWFSLLLGSASGLALAAWVSAVLSWPTWAKVASMVTLALAGAAVGLRALRTPDGTLRRHDEVWWWHHVGQIDLSTESGTRGDVIVTIDLGRWMFVRFDPVGAHGDVTPRRRRRPLWLPLSAAAADSAAWSAWRALLLSRRATLPDHLRQAASGPATGTDR